MKSIGFYLNERLSDHFSISKFPKFIENAKIAFEDDNIDDFIKKKGLNQDEIVNMIKTLVKSWNDYARQKIKSIWFGRNHIGIGFQFYIVDITRISDEEVFDVIYKDLGSANDDSKWYWAKPRLGGAAPHMIQIKNDNIDKIIKENT